MRRVNKAVELLAAGQPVYYESVEQGGFKAGRKAARTFADYLNYDMEHHPFDAIEWMPRMVARGFDMLQIVPRLVKIVRSANASMIVARGPQSVQFVNGYK